MSRSPRRESPTSIYHVFLRGNNKEHIFRTDYEKAIMRKMIKENMETYKVEIYAYCIMSNHIHLLIKVPFSDLSEYIKTIALSYAIFYNARHNHVGHVFQGRFRSECIDSEHYFWTCLRYIHLNPVKAGISKDMLEYNFSSAREYFGEKRSLLHEKALKFYKKKFADESSFKVMHEIFEPRTYLDIAEDIEYCQKEILVYLLQELMKEQKIEEEKIIFDTPRFRQELKKRFGKYVHISNENYKNLLKTIIGTR